MPSTTSRRHLRHLDPPALAGNLRGALDGREHLLGGEDFDQRIMDWLIEDFERETSIDLKEDRMASSASKEAAERAKWRAFFSPGDGDQPAVHLRDRSGPATSPRTLTATSSRSWCATW